MKRRTGYHPRLVVDTAAETPVGAAGGVLLTGTVAESATRLRGRLPVGHRAATAVTVFRRTGHWRLSSHVYTTPHVLEEFADRVVPAICALVDPARAR